MKILLVLIVALSLIVGGCATVCTKISKEDTDKAQETLKQIQTYYPMIVDLLPLVPYIGEPLKIAIPLLIGLTDTTLQALGKMIEQGCADQVTLKLAQDTLTQIQTLLAKPEVQLEIKKAKVKRALVITR